jgi:hypothetical protein
LLEVLWFVKAEEAKREREVEEWWWVEEEFL